MEFSYFNIVCSFTWFIFTLILSFHLSLPLKHIFTCRNMKRLKPVLYSNCFPLEASYKSIIFVLLLVFVMWMNSILFLTIFLSYFLYTCVTTPESNNVNEKYKTSLGYGCAVSYYKNYLTRIINSSFVERIEQFQTYHKVEIQKKLFILFPKSCRIHDYLDDSDNIERCRELDEYQESVAGIARRTYNITVYLIKNPNYLEGVRLPVEYAMPLKGLYAMKEHNQISREEMFHNYHLFIKYLKEFIKEDKDNMGKYCELVEFDDEECNVADLLFNRSFSLPEIFAL